MSGDRITATVIALSVLMIGACGQRSSVPLNGTIDDGGHRRDQIVPPTSWAVSAGGNNIANGSGIAVDGSGNSYVIGNFHGTATLGSTTLTSKGQGDIFVAKLNSDGQFLWVVSAGGTSNNFGRSIAVDGSGNSYISGDVMGTATFGSTTLFSKDRDIFVAKLDSSGKFLWAVTAGGQSTDYSHSIAVDGSGNSYITGDVENPTTFGSTTLTSKSQRIFVAKLDSGGAFAWAISAGGATHSTGRSIDVDSSGNSYVAGDFVSPGTFGSTTLTSKSHRGFVAKLDSGGKFVWAVSAGGEFSGIRAIAVDSSGNNYVTGDFFGTATFGSTTLTSKKNKDFFVAKLDSGGTFIWAVSAVSAGGTYGSYGQSIAVDGLGNSYVTGDFKSPVTLGSTVLTPKGLGDVFVAKLDSGGKFVWAVSAGSQYADFGQSVAVTGSGNSYFTGRFMGAATFGSTTLISKGYSDIFVAKLDSNGKL
jgi:Beta-propeller repeat